MNVHDPLAVHVESLYNSIEGMTQRTACGKDIKEYEKQGKLLISSIQEEVTCEGCLNELEIRKERRGSYCLNLKG